MYEVGCFDSSTVQLVSLPTKQLHDLKWGQHSGLQYFVNQDGFLPNSSAFKCINAIEESIGSELTTH